MAAYHFELKFIIEKNGKVTIEPQRVTVADAPNHTEASKLAWKDIRARQQALLNQGAKGVNTAEFKTIL